MKDFTYEILDSMIHLLLEVQDLADSDHPNYHLYLLFAELLNQSILQSQIKIILLPVVVTFLDAFCFGSATDGC